MLDLDGVCSDEVMRPTVCPFDVSTVGRYASASGGDSYQQQRSLE